MEGPKRLTHCCMYKHRYLVASGCCSQIEVKAGNTATKSLNRFIETYKPSIAYKIVDGNVGMSDNKLTIPHYMAIFI